MPAEFHYRLSAPVDTVWPTLAPAVITVCPDADVSEIPRLFRVSASTLYRSPTLVAMTLAPAEDDTSALRVLVTTMHITTTRTKRRLADDIARAAAHALHR
ncbi:hypothetical protein [Stackebrandtia soli]|uniref:hypothetical protein n=1 Tax=Stackebrandtia soli TaxID=1892856 RepID=UPI0039EA2826